MVVTRSRMMNVNSNEDKVRKLLEQIRNGTCDAYLQELQEIAHTESAELAKAEVA